MFGGRPAREKMAQQPCSSELSLHTRFIGGRIQLLLKAQSQIISGKNLQIPCQQERTAVRLLQLLQSGESDSVVRVMQCKSQPQQQQPEQVTYKLEVQ